MHKRPFYSERVKNTCYARLTLSLIHILLMLNFPTNPTGAVAPVETLQEIARILSLIHI